MSSIERNPRTITARRTFLARAVFGLATVGAAPRLLDAAELPTTEHDAWLDGLRGKHKQFFDVAAANAGAPLGRATSFLDAYATAYGLSDADVNVVFGAHGSGLSLVLDDHTWAAFALGEHYGIDDSATKARATRNPYSGYGQSISVTPSVRSLQQRGVRFLACMQTVGRLSRELAAQHGEREAEIRNALVAGLLPGVTAVPAMIVAANRAQEAGLTYVYAG